MNLIKNSSKNVSGFSIAKERKIKLLRKQKKIGYRSQSFLEFLNGAEGQN